MMSSDFDNPAANRTRSREGPPEPGSRERGRANPAHAATPGNLSLPNVSEGRGQRAKRLSRAAKLLVLVWLLTLPFVNPWVRGDGVGYYAYIQALLTRGDLNFQSAWLHGNASFLLNRVDAQGQLLPDQFTSTGHLINHFTVGPAILWAPFLVPVHLAVLGLDRAGWQIVADGFSRPYRVAMALGTATYGFLALWLSFLVAREYFEERAALVATLGIWFGSSLTVYMYFNPSWAHAPAAFSVALFLWYWHRTRHERKLMQWIWLGLAGGLMLDVYYPNCALFVLPLADAVRGWSGCARAKELKGEAMKWLVASHLSFAVGVVIAFLPTLVTRWEIFGSPFQSGYGEWWVFTAPFAWQVLFASNHGLFTWTPLLALATAGLAVFWRRERRVGGLLLAVLLIFYYIISCYQNWAGLASYGNRFFVSLTAIFILGLAALLNAASCRPGANRAAWRASCAVVGLLVLWNLAFIFQWGTQMVPARGPISWRQMAYNQVFVVPERAGDELRRYFGNRAGMMRRINEEDLRNVERREGRNPDGGKTASPR